MSRQNSGKISVDNLGPSHHSAFKKALSNVLSTNLAEKTYAQIVDGLPTTETWYEYANRRHEPIERHKDICPAAFEVVDNFRQSFDPSILQFNESPVQAYQNTALGSRAFNLRLIEMTAIACHEIASLLFRNAKGGFHKECESWKPQPTMTIPFGSSEPVVDNIPDFPPTVFFHNSYMAHDQYPHGIADMAGYWAESRLFGGVVLFDRGEGDKDCKDVFIHPVGGRRLIFQLSEDQIQRFARFLLMVPPSNEIPSPLPFLPEELARRVDPWEAMSTLHIFRNRYERKLPEYRTYNCVPSIDDYPEIKDIMKTVRERFLRDR